MELRSQIDYRSHLPGQLVNHIVNNDILTTKIGLLTTLRDHFCRMKANINSNKSQMKGMKHPPWVPITYDLDLPEDVTALHTIFSDKEKGKGEVEVEELVWIYNTSRVYFHC